MKRLSADDSAVSETLGYIMIATILFISFTLIFTIGYPIYNKYVDSGHIQNIEKSFTILAHSGNLVAMQKSTITTSEIKMYGGMLATRDTGTLALNVSYFSDEAGAHMIGTSGSLNLSALEYSKGGVSVAYVDGSVCRSDLNGAVMLQEPEISSGTDFLLIPIVNLYESHVGIGGDTLTRITLMTPYYSKMSQTIGSLGPEITPGVRKVSVVMTGDYAHCFGQYFQEKLGFTESVGADGALILNRTYSPGIKLILLKMSDVTVSVN